MMTELNLAHGLAFEDLYAREGLAKLDAAFISTLAETDTSLHNQLMEVRAGELSLSEKEEAQLLIDLAPHVEDFVVHLFGIEHDAIRLQQRHEELAIIYKCKRLFVQRKALRAFKPDEASEFSGFHLRRELESFFTRPLSEQSFSENVMRWLDEPAEHEKALDLATRYAAWALHSERGKTHHKEGVLFKVPKKLVMEDLVPVETILQDGVKVKRCEEHEWRRREGFALTDPGATLDYALDSAHYCIYCHNQGKDSCSKGLREKTGEFKKSPFGVPLAGCPLEERISEMNTLKGQGYSVGALSVVTLDNPMAAATGHRICNDCMKACIYQKQDPVNIPQVETRTLRDVLALPWGFEIYSLLTRWNPLNFTQPIPKEESGYNVLVSGLGPAGFTLTHYLLNEGHTVVGIDGLKIEPLAEEISGVKADGSRVPFVPIHRVDDIFESLDERVQAGFGGVAEYGITVRWNKNYLKLVRLLLERRQHFAMFGGVRLGSTFTQEQAFEMGFHHIALAMGAGKPTVLSIPNGVARGVRTASDFLMALQLTGAAKKDSVANLQLRLPVVVIGGGLTAVDAATESLAYYPVQVEKFLQRYEQLVEERGESVIRAGWSDEDAEIAGEFITHAKAIREERALARKEERAPDLIGLMNTWGGVKLAYRRRFIDAPSYRLNHEEVELAMQEGIGFAENMTPVAIEVDKYDHVAGLKVSHPEDGETVLNAKTVFVAAGTSPNTVLQREEPGSLTMDGKYFQAVDEEGNPVSPEWISKPEDIHVLVAFDEQKRATSFFGDLHPSYAGNVVKAMGSAKQGYPTVSRVLSRLKKSSQPSADFLHTMNMSLRATVHDVIRLTPNIIEIVVKAPLAARAFRPGQFYRLQNYDAFCRKVEDTQGNHTNLAMEGLALTGASVDKEEGLLSTIVLEMGGSSDLCAYLEKDEPVVLMGPTGTPTETPGGETVMLVGGGLGNAVLFSIGKALKDAGSRVLYFAGYKKSIDRYKVKEIEEVSDIIIWCCDEASFTPERAQDKAFHGNIVQAMVAYASGELGDAPISMAEVDRLVVIGSDRMMQAVGQARHTVLKEYLKPEHHAIGSINSPMQCMMKEICAQCLQKHVDPKTGEETYVYSCFNQDQCLDRVDFPHLNERLKQNSVQEKVTKHWIDRCLKGLELREEQAA